jgi:hypothetical protein
VQGAGFIVQDLGLRIWLKGSCFRVKGIGVLFRVFQGSMCSVVISGCGI